MGEEFAGRFEHVSFGELESAILSRHAKLTGSGRVNGMSTRKGTVVFLDDILVEAATTMHEQMAANEVKYAQIEDPEMTSQIIGSTAVKIQDMSGKR